MLLKLYLANFPSGAGEEQFQALFASVGQITRVKMLKHNDDEPGRVVVWLETEQDIESILSTFNGRLWDGHRICLSPSKPPDDLPEPTPEQQQFVHDLAVQLGETEAEPCEQLLDIVRLCSTSFAQAVLADTLDVEAHGGMPVRDGSRQRTRGGIFFYLARGRLPIGLQQIIVPHLRKAKAEQQSKPVVSKAAVKAPSLPVHTEEEIAAVRERLIQLRCEHEAAQSALENLRSQPTSKQAGMFSAIKRVLDFQREIDTILKEYPSLTSE